MTSQHNPAAPDNFAGKQCLSVGMATLPASDALEFYVLPATILVLRCVLPPAEGNLLYLALMAYATLGTRQAICALIYGSLFITNASQAFAAPPTQATTLRHVLLLTCVLSMVLRSIPRKPNSTLPITASLTAWLVTSIHSLLISVAPWLSLAKATAAWSCLTSLTLANFTNSRLDRTKLGQQMVSGLAVTATASLLLALSPQAYTGGRLLAGSLKHSQQLGTMMAILACISTCKFLVEQKSRISDIVKALLAISLLYLSGSRTGAAAYILAVAAAIFMNYTLSYKAGNLRPRITRIVATAVALLVFGLVNGEQAYQNTLNFIQKGDANKSPSLDYSSRYVVVNPMLESIRLRPLTGLGFGTPSIGGKSSIVVVDKNFEITSMATTEKGNTFVAVVEELGFISSIPTFFYLTVLAFRAYRSGVTPWGTALCVLLINFGEAALFSPGGIGVVHEVFLVFSAAGDTDRLTPASTTTSSETTRGVRKNIY